MRRVLVGLIATLFFATAAYAIDQPYVYPITIGTSPAQILASNAARKKLIFVNPNATALVAVCPITSRADSSSITCAIHGAGSITILPYDRVEIDGVGQNGTIPSAWNGVSDTSSSSLTIIESE